MRSSHELDPSSTKPSDEAAPDGTAQNVVHPLLRRRFSPTAFDGTHRMAWEDVLLLVEAARWAPSAGNSQPWMFRPIMRATRDHELLMPLLAASSRSWAASATLVMLNLRRRFVEGSSIEYSDFSDYDLGQGVAHMTIQAQSMGLACRQFRAFDQERVAHGFRVPNDWELRTMTAVGKSAQTPPHTRCRRSLGDILTKDSPRSTRPDQASR